MTVSNRVKCARRLAFPADTEPRALFRLALVSGISVATLRAIERQEPSSLRIDWLEQIAAGLGVSVAWLSFGTPQQPEPHRPPVGASLCQRLSGWLGYRLHHLRRRQPTPLAEADLARAAGLDGAVVKDLEQCRVALPTTQVVEELARVLCCQPQYLAYGIGQASYPISNEFRQAAPNDYDDVAWQQAHPLLFPPNLERHRPGFP